jgi:hypothetical protein
MRPILFLSLALFLLGCNQSQSRYAGYTQGTGNLIPFALAHAIDCGGHPTTTNGLPAIETGWKFKEDKNGVQIYADGDHFKEIKEFLSKAFGEPDISKGSKLSGGPEAGRPWTSFAWYSVRDVGVGIEYFGNDKECGLIIIRPQ